MRNLPVSVPATGLPGQSFLESVARPRPSRTAPIGLALLFHLTAATALTVSTTFVLDDSIEPPLPKIEFFTMSSSIPVSGPAKPPAERPASQNPPAAPQKVYAPQAIPQHIPVAPAEAEAEAHVPSASGPYVEGGLDQDTPAGGGMGILGTESGTTQTGVLEPAEPIRITTGVTEPVETLRVNPVYPEAARKGRIEGTVILEAIISASGQVESVRVLRSAHPLLDRAALDAVPQWRYRPALFNGRPVAVYLSVAVHFQLR